MPREKYWERIARAIASLAKPGDRLQCTEVWQAEDSTACELCGHFPIAYLHRLTNPRTGRSLIVGSRCILNWRRLPEWDQLAVEVGPGLEWWAQRMNKRVSGLVSINPALGTDARRGLEFKYDEDDEDLGDDDDHDPDEEAPEGLGSDEVDWDSL